MDLATGKYAGPTKFTLPAPAIDQWWVVHPATGNILSAIYDKDVVTVVALNPSLLNVTKLASISLKLDYYPGNMGMA